jgi:hypothetical protein
MNRLKDANSALFNVLLDTGIAATWPYDYLSSCELIQWQAHVDYIPNVRMLYCDAELRAPSPENKTMPSNGFPTLFQHRDQ